MKKVEMSLIRTYAPPALTVLAWLASVALAILDIFFVREIFFSLIARFKPGYFAAIFWGDIVVVVGAVIVVIYFIWSAEYHRKMRNLQTSWKVLGKTFLVLLLIPILAYFM